MWLNCCHLMMNEWGVASYGWAKKVASWDGIALGEDAAKIVEMIRKDLEYFISLVDKGAAGFGRIDSNFERSSTVCKMLSNGVACYRVIIRERKSQSMGQTWLLSSFKETAAATPAFSNHHPISQKPSTLRQDPLPAERLWLAEGSDHVYHFLAI